MCSTACAGTGLHLQRIRRVLRFCRRNALWTSPHLRGTDGRCARTKNEIVQACVVLRNPTRTTLMFEFSIKYFDQHLGIAHLALPVKSERIAIRSTTLAFSRMTHFDLNQPGATTAALTMHDRAAILPDCFAAQVRCSRRKIERKLIIKVPSFSVCALSNAHLSKTAIYYVFLTLDR
jgi:hypothetical protein